MKKLFLAVVLVVSAFFTSSVFAAFTPVSVSSWSYGAQFSGYGSATALCDAVIRARKPGGTSYDVVINNSVNCTATAYGGPYGEFGYGEMYWSFSQSSSASCPANSTGTTSCVCNSGFDQNVNSCVPHVISPAEICDALNATDYALAGKGTPSLSVAYGGVTVTGTGAAGGFKNGVSTGFEIFGPFTCSAMAVPVADTGSPIVDPSTPSPSTCSGYWGSVNGVDTCVPKAPTPGVAGASSASSSTSSTSGGVTTGSATSGSTVCDGVNCTTTTTTTPIGGGAPVTQSDTKPQETYCSANPGAAQCQPADPCKDSTKAGCAELGSSTAPAFGNIDSGFSGITAVAFGSSSTCPPDVTVNAMGRELHFSYSGTCDALQSYVKPILIVLAAFAAAMLFAGGFKV